jgi:hypothetical protein
MEQHRRGTVETILTDDGVLQRVLVITPAGRRAAQIGAFALLPRALVFSPKKWFAIASFPSFLSPVTAMCAKSHTPPPLEAEHRCQRCPNMTSLTLARGRDCRLSEEQLLRLDVRGRVRTGRERREQLLAKFDRSVVSGASAPARNSHFTHPLAPARKLFCRNGPRRADYRKSEI